MTLATLQRDFRHWLTDGTATASARFDARAQPGLLIYQNNYRAALVECLTERFERVHLWLGDAAFLAAAIAHIDATPPSAWTLDAYGAGFADTLAGLYPQDREVAEIAWLDQALSNAFTAPDATPLSAQAIAQIDWDHAILTLTPTLAMANVHSNAAAVWSALSAGDMPPASQRLDPPQTMLVWRQDFTPCFRTIDAQERDAISAIRAGATFAQLCTDLIDALGEAEGVGRAGAYLGQWFSDALVTGLSTATPSSCYPPRNRSHA